MTTPAGRPAWERTAGITHYGGHTSKADYMGQGAVNPRTDVDAAAIMRMADHLAAAARTCPFCVICYTNQDTATSDPVVHSCYMMTGVDSDGYADAGNPPTGFPTGERQGDGDVIWTFSSTYNDAYGVSGTLDIDHADACCNSGGGSNVTTPVEISSATTVRVRTFAADTGAAATDKLVTLAVW